eukprot:1166452-Amphidinium_carterae.2
MQGSADPVLDRKRNQISLKLKKEKSRQENLKKLKKKSKQQFYRILKEEISSLTTIMMPKKSKMA